MSWWVHTARLASILAGVGLATTRLGLIAHEFVGHGGAAIAFGGRVEQVRLFWFAGGWIDYDLPKPYTVTASLAASLGGIALEFVVGLAVWLALARRESLVGKLVRATGAAIAIHAMWYLALGTYHGFGDGAFLRWWAGDKRYAIAFAAGAVVLAFSFFAARSIWGVLCATIPGGRRAQTAGVVLAVTLSATLHVGLAIGEVRVRRDEAYGAVMKPERERVVAREMRQWEREQKQRGVEIDVAARKAREAALAAKHRELPFGVILGVLTFVAICAGAWRARPGGESLWPFREIPRRLVLVVATIAAGSIALVIAIDAAFA
ncbi:MAG: hypothetical protein M4D80_02640 [Myxococcota bacterium]|nr:hypothetical protein [Myxococcota bacterium]